MAHGEVLVLANPAAGRSRSRARIRRLERLARRRGLELELSKGAADLTRRAERAAARGVGRVIAAGGDGTLHHVVQGLAGTSCALGLVPLGSGNDLARVLGLPFELEAALATAVDGPLRRIDLVQAGERLFVGVGGVGFDSEVAARAAAVRWPRGAAIYLWMTLLHLARFRPPRLTVTSESDRFEGAATLAAVANTCAYGGGMRIAPAALPDDGLLDVVVVERLPKLTLLRVFPRVYRGRHLEHPGVRCWRTRRVELCADRPMTLYADGEPVAPVGERPLVLELRERALAVAVRPRTRRPGRAADRSRS